MKKALVDNSEDDLIEDEENTDDNEKSNDVDTAEFNQKCELLLEKITNNYKEQRDDIKSLMKLHKKEMKNAKKNKRTKNVKTKTGFTKPTIVPNKLADFVGVDHGTEMSRTKLTKLISDEFKKRNLGYEKDKRVIIPDDEVKKLFNLSDDAVKSRDPKDKNGLNFYTLQKHIAHCYNTANIPNNNDLKINDKINTNKTGKRKIISNKQ